MTMVMGICRDHGDRTFVVIMVMGICRDHGDGTLHICKPGVYYLIIIV